MLMVVDDDGLLRSYLSRGLARHGIQVLPAESGEAAIALLETSPEIDAVLVDLNLSGMSGAYLRTLLSRSHPELPVHLMTGMDQLALHGLSSASRILHKPFHLDEVLKLLSE